MPNSWNKQSYVQGFDWKSIDLKKPVSMFEHTKIYEDLVESSLKIYKREYATRDDHSRKNRGEYALSHTSSAMS